MNSKCKIMRQGMGNFFLARNLNAVAGSPAQQFGFSASHGVNWSDYVRYRHAYRPSFFQEIFDYHSEKPDVSWGIAHDKGAGCGIVASSLASRFGSVIVSDPNDGHVTVAQQFLEQQYLLSERKFKFLQERAEESSVESDTVDLISASECIYWTDIDAAIQEFHRELRTDGSLVITHYSTPLIIGNNEAQKAWYEILKAHAWESQGHLLQCFPVMNSGLECLRFPRACWYDVRRVYINTKGSLEAFKLSEHEAEESKVQNWERKLWIENDQGWVACQAFDWFKNFFATLRWPTIPRHESRLLWDSLETALGNRKAKIEVPVAMVFARKKE